MQTAVHYLYSLKIHTKLILLVEAIESCSLYPRTTFEALICGPCMSVKQHTSLESHVEKLKTLQPKMPILKPSCQDYLFHILFPCCCAFYVRQRIRKHFGVSSVFSPGPISCIKDFFMSFLCYPVTVAQNQLCIYLTMEKARDLFCKPPLNLGEEE